MTASQASKLRRDKIIQAKKAKEQAAKKPNVLKFKKISIATEEKAPGLGIAIDIDEINKLYTFGGEQGAKIEEGKNELQDFE